MASSSRATGTVVDATVHLDPDDPAVAVPFVDPPPAAIPDSLDSADLDADWLYSVDWPVAAAAATRPFVQHEPARVDPAEPTEDATPTVIDAPEVIAVELTTAFAVVAADCQRWTATVVAVVDRPAATFAAPVAEVDSAIDAIAASETVVAVAVC